MQRALFSASLLLALAACADDRSSPLAPDGANGGSEAAALTTQLTGRIVFSAPNGQTELDVFTMNPDGSGRTAIVTLPHYDMSPAWSWDNQTIAFLRSRPDGANVQHNEVYLVDKNGGNGHWLTTNPIGIEQRNPAWSPDDKHIVVDTPNADLLVIDVATGAVNTLPYKGETASFDPTGDLIAFSSPSVLRVAKADGSGVVRTIPAPSGNFVRYAAFSPDGTRLAFGAAPVGRNDSDIGLDNTDGTGQKRLVGGPANDWGPAWSPDGQMIVYTSSKRTDAAEIMRIPVTGGRKTRLTTGGGQWPAWTH